jgi:hypothetical protein
MEEQGVERSKTVENTEEDQLRMKKETEKIRSNIVFYHLHACYMSHSSVT